MTSQSENLALAELKAIRQEIAIALPKLSERIDRSAAMMGTQMAAGNYQLASKLAAMDAANILDYYAILMSRFERAVFNAYGMRAELGEGHVQFMDRVDALMKMG
jgi:hypothetical protein